MPLQGDHMTKITDEILMAYVDGEVGSKEAKDIRKAMESDPEVLQRVEMFRESSAMLKGVYDEPMQERVAERLIDTVDDFRSRISVPPLIERVLTFLHMPPNWKTAYALAASVVLLIGTGTVYLATNTTETDSNYYSAIFNDANLSRGLETTPSGKIISIGDRGVQIRPVATFLDKSNHYCRQYDVIAGQDKNTLLAQGIACRTKQGEWHTIISINLHPHSPGSSNIKAGYIPAGGDNLINVMVSRIMGAPPMTLERESKLIKTAWNEKPDYK
jgi:hypothetical protein